MNATSVVDKRKYSTHRTLIIQLHNVSFVGLLFVCYFKLTYSYRTQEQLSKKFNNDHVIFVRLQMHIGYLRLIPVLSSVLVCPTKQFSPSPQGAKHAAPSRAQSFQEETPALECQQRVDRVYSPLQFSS